jgi:molybdopterin-guanine dinucleotide biosynthesis protein A/rhodanese-related sulfurtransferase
MGRDKAFVEVDGVPMVRKAVDALTAAGATTVTVIGGDRPRLESLGLTVVDDPRPFAGPLAALVTALAVPATGPDDDEIVMVMACDLTDPSPEAITITVEAVGSADAAVPTDGEHAQWLHAAWRRRSRPTLHAAYEAGERSIRAAVVDLDLRPVTGIAAHHLTDADAPDDLPLEQRGGPGPGPTPYPSRMDIAEIDIHEFADRHGRGVPVLDVREHDEFEEARVPGAIHIPLGQLPDRLHEVPDGDLHVICKMGGRSAKAVEFLAAQNRPATNIAGGTLGWIEAGHPVDRGAGSA